MQRRKRIKELQRQRDAARTVLDRCGSSMFKKASSAQWTRVSVSPRGAIRVQIQHEDIKGCSPEMLKWWFENLAGSTTWDGCSFAGPSVSHYHLWHHRDHIAITPLTGAERGANKGFKVGEWSRIEERFGGRYERIRATVLTTVLDETEFTFSVMLFKAVEVGRIVHRYERVAGGVSFYSETLIDVRLPVVGPVLNWLVRPWIYSRSTAHRWIVHNIEETGRTEDVLPVLYGHAVTAKESTWQTEASGK